MSLRVLGLDPAPDNYGFSVTKVQGEPNTGDPGALVIETGVLNNSLTNPSETNNNLPKFADEMAEIIKKHNPDLVGIERFMLRGKMSKKVSDEAINMMIGVVSYLSHLNGTTTSHILASHWKNEIKKKVNMVGFYKVCNSSRIQKEHESINLKPGTKSQVILEGHTDHEVDATLISIYTGAKVLGFKPYSNLDRHALAELSKRIREAPRYG